MFGRNETCLLDKEKNYLKNITLKLRYYFVLSLKIVNNLYTACSVLKLFNLKYFKFLKIHFHKNIVQDIGHKNLLF